MISLARRLALRQEVESLFDEQADRVADARDGIDDGSADALTTIRGARPAKRPKAPASPVPLYRGHPCADCGTDTGRRGKKVCDEHARRRNADAMLKRYYELHKQALCVLCRKPTGGPWRHTECARRVRPPPKPCPDCGGKRGFRDRRCAPCKQAKKEARAAAARAARGPRKAPDLGMLRCC